MMRHTFNRAAWSFVGVLCAGTLLCAAPRAHAGSVLLSRESDLRATGAGDALEYDLSNGTADLERFVDNLLSDRAAPARSSADQDSAPNVAAGGKLAGASAKGSAKAAVDAGAPDAFCDAATNFDIFFSVDQKPAMFRLDAALAAGGDATTGISLRRASAPDDMPLISIDVTADSQSVSRSAELVPGTYGLSVWAFARGTPAESAASYAVSVGLDESQGGSGAPVPLPAAIWGGAVGLSGVALLVRRWRGQARTVT